MASETKLIYSAIWLRLPELPTEFYDLQVLKKLGNTIGKLLTIDTWTSSTTRGRYARLCVEVPLDKSLKTHLFIGNRRQIILYDGLNMLCTSCGHLGRNTRACPHLPPVHTPPHVPTHNQSQPQNYTATPSTSINTPSNEEEWKLV